MKRRSLALSLLTLTLLSACQAGPSLNPPSTVRSQSAGVSARADWFSQLPANLQAYYADARGKTGQELFDSLHEITGRNYRALGYGEARNFLYSTADNFALNGKTGVVDVYSNLFIQGSGGNGNDYRERGDENKDGTPGDFINAEHTWPQSFFGKAMPMVSDMHHLFPSLSKPNGMRGHHPFGLSSEGQTVYSTISGSKLIVRSSKRSPIAVTAELDDKEVTPFSNQDSVFEPGNSQKGNTARALQYFWLRYKDKAVRGGDFGPDFFSKRVAQFREWSEKVDPVDERERTREEFVFQKQGNRNPFTDIPNLASIIGDDVMARL